MTAFFEMEMEITPVLGCSFKEWSSGTHHILCLLYPETATIVLMNCTFVIPENSMLPNCSFTSNHLSNNFEVTCRCQRSMHTVPHDIYTNWYMCYTVAYFIYSHLSIGVFQRRLLLPPPENEIWPLLQHSTRKLSSCLCVYVTVCSH